MTRGQRFIQLLIADYENAAQYWRLFAQMHRDYLRRYRYMPGEIETIENDIAFAERSAAEMQANADQLRGDKGEIPESVSQLPERHTEQLQKVTCTTVL